MNCLFIVYQEELDGLCDVNSVDNAGELRELQAAEEEFTKLPVPDEIASINFDLEDFYDEDWHEFLTNTISRRFSATRRAIISHIAGWVVRVLLPAVPCEDCQDALQVDKGD